MSRRLVALISMLALGFSAVPAGAQTQAVPSMYAGMHWRYVGPARGGRTVGVAGVPGDIRRYYMAAVNGGIWTTDDAGRTWTPIFDAADTSSIGAIALAPSDSNVIYAGSGEGLQRPDLAVGDGMYKSTDAGKTWTHQGLDDAQQIGAIAVDPRDANVAYVAALGHPYGPNPTRGVYRTIDGGATWMQVLYKDENTGAFDVTIDSSHPDTVYATLWSARQAPWEIGSSFEIPQSGVYKSTDRGGTWTPVTAGLPQRFGRSFVAVAPSNSKVVYIYADAYADGDPGGALYRSDDGGGTFAKVNDEPQIAQRGDDLVTLAVDPKDSQTVYVTDTSAYRSTDGGKTMVAIKGAPGGDDYHTAWINPSNPDAIIFGVDQGATISLNGGRTWSSWYNQPTAQMYHVNADDRFPYWICGGQQESGSACVVSRGAWGEVTQRDWHPAGAEEYGYVVPDPLHPGVFYGGKVERYDERSGQTQEVSPLAGTRAFRAIRTEPLAFNRVDKHILYFGTNVVFATSDGGMHWHKISPDLTRAHPAVPDVLGPFAQGDPQNGNHRGVVYALAPSYVSAKTLWAGTDDGLVWITRDGGAHWKNVTPPDLTPWSKISQIDVPPGSDDTAYLAVNRFRLDDLAPHVYSTHDGGAHWLPIGGGLPQQPVNAVRVDPVVHNLLYAATENGVNVSFDDGATWQSLQLNLPHTSVRDAIVHGNDLIVATHGRGFWILDDVEPLRELARHGSWSTPHLFAPAAAYRVRRDTNSDTPLPPEEPAGTNPPDGAILDYALPADAQHVRLDVLDASRSVVRSYSSDDVAPAPIGDLDKPTSWERPFSKPETGAGMHRFVWDIREPVPDAPAYDLPISAVDDDTPRVPQGALLPPGHYTVRLAVDGAMSSQPLTILMDPRVAMTPAQLREQYVLAHRLATLLDRVSVALSSTKDAKQEAQLSGLSFRLFSLLDIIDGADAPVTSQAKAQVAVVTADAGHALAASSAKPRP
ncbi:MAG TPA: glycoside hydrolase [Verrucomicrobiae bacterium]|nr:glycoside hydrolase [Verrucomicrobiae bacterium]